MKKNWQYFDFDSPRAEFIVGPDGRNRTDLEVEVAIDVAFILGKYATPKLVKLTYDTTSDVKSFLALEVPIIPSGSDLMCIGQFPVKNDQYITTPGAHSLTLEDRYGHAILSLHVADPMLNKGIHVKDHGGKLVDLDLLEEVSDALRIVRGHFYNEQFPRNNTVLSTNMYPIALTEPDFDEIVAGYKI